MVIDERLRWCSSRSKATLEDKCAFDRARLRSSLRYRLAAVSSPPVSVLDRPTVLIRRMIVLGAGGDLAGRLLLPGLAGLLSLGKLPDGFQLVGVDREPWDGAEFRSTCAR